MKVDGAVCPWCDGDLFEQIVRYGDGDLTEHETRCEHCRQKIGVSGEVMLVISTTKNQSPKGA